METKESLKEYACAKFEEVVDKKKRFGALQNYILPAMLNLIDENWKFITKDCIDRAVNCQYKIKIRSVDEQPFNALSVKTFDDDGNVIYDKYSSVVLCLPPDLHNIDEDYIFDKDEFSVPEFESIKNFYQNMDKNNFNTSKKISSANKKENKTFNGALMLILKHEMSHTMSKSQIAQYDEYRKLNCNIKNYNELQERPVIFLCGGIKQMSCAYEDCKFAKEEVIRKNGVYNAHEGLTEYIAFKDARVNKIENSFDAMGAFGGKYIGPCYAPYVWLMGAVNALSNDMFLHAYYKGYEVFDNNATYDTYRKMYERVVDDTTKLEEMTNRINNKLIDCELEDLRMQIDEDKTAFSLKFPDNNMQKFIQSEKKKIQKILEEYVGIDIGDIEAKQVKNQNAEYLARKIALKELLLENQVHQLDGLNQKYIAQYKRLMNDLQDSVELQMSYYLQLKQSNKIDAKHSKEFEECMGNLLNYKNTWEPIINIYDDTHTLFRPSKVGFELIKDKILINKKQCDDLKQ